MYTIRTMLVDTSTDVSITYRVFLFVRFTVQVYITGSTSIFVISSSVNFMTKSNESKLFLDT